MTTDDRPQPDRILAGVYATRLGLIAALIACVGLIVWWLGYSGRAAILAAVLVAALSAVPVLLNLEGLQRAMRWGRFRL